MKQNVFLLPVVALFFFHSPVDGQNRLTVELDNYRSVSVSGGIDVELVPSDHNNVMSITARDGQPEEVKYEIENGELTIRVRPDFNNDDEVKVILPYRELYRIEASSGALINSRKVVRGNVLELKSTSGGKIELSVEVKTIVAKVTQMADIVLYGKTDMQTVQAGSGGNYLAYDLNATETVAKASAGAQVKVLAQDKIDATAGSKGFIGYIGDPAATRLKTSLGGEVMSFRTKEAALGY